MAILNFFGDVYLDGPRRAEVPLEGDYVCNLESPVTLSSKPVWGKINLKSAGVYFKDTFGKNPLAVCLANNHIMDYGHEGFLETVGNLQTHGIRYFGAGSLADHCHNPLILELAGQRIALMGYVCPTTHPVFAAAGKSGVAPIDPEAMANDFLVAKKGGAERIIVQLHWGQEEVRLPRPTDVVLAQRLIELGADMIIGHHAHCIQPFENFKGKYVFYGLGNTIFPDTELVSYSKDGRRENNRQIKWKKWNRESLAVRYDTITQAVNVRLLFFKNSLAVVPGDHWNTVFAFRKKTASRYAKQYAWTLRRSMFRRLAVSFLSRPRIPKKENLNWLTDLFRIDKKK